MMPPTLVFAPETINIAETTRMIEVARRCREDFRCVFFGYSDQYAGLITDAGFEFKRMQPWLTPQKIEHLWRVDRMESLADPFTQAELETRVESELALYREQKPAGVVIGFTLSATLSARIARIPLVYVMPFPLTRPYLEAGLARWPAEFDYPILSWIPKSCRDAWINRWFLHTGLWIGPFKAVAKKFGIRPPERLVDVYEGDHNLVTDIPELTGVDELPEHWQYVGPIYARLDGEAPPELLQRSSGKPLIYCAMGSSANRDILRTVVESFRGMPYDVVAPIKTHVEKMQIAIPPNVTVYDWLPAHKVNPLADLAVIHGGQGTVQTACASGTPFIGIGLQPEQEGNIDLVVRYGSAAALSKRRLSRDRLQAEIEKVMADDTMRQKARQLQQVMRAWDGPENVAAFLRGRFL